MDRVWVAAATVVLSLAATLVALLSDNQALLEVAHTSAGELAATSR